MNLNTDLYQLEDVEEETLKYIFISQGKEVIVKAIEYQYVQPLRSYQIYNLAFGNYDIEKDEIIDNVVSNNDDGRKVFNTVLSSIPRFFGNYSDRILMVRGSDGTKEFLQICQEACDKCGEGNCRKFNQRLRIYTNYIDANYDDLIKQYKFYGGIEDENNNINLVDYNSTKKHLYNIVYVIKNK
ncbi:hypothetical protein ASG01_14950 [Chryseobacterium sp. Leaf180]|uniref:DUF6934 family protein n=1 Tax=Chryseobacterium sp. Leaf180 TaxID=1736289 RepID=UPI0006F85CAC|nr:hypothetical protein [Chryseobacterium sp. Leaf180]KQR90859.1 hypothetical protein ASG01_14950 [Chryseobacterium sp. Leaf180]